MKITVKKSLANFAYAIKLIFSASKKYFILKSFLSVLSSLVPYIPMLLWRDLVDALVAFAENVSPDSVPRIWRFVFLYCLIILVEKILQTISSRVVFKYEDAINYYLDNLMVDRVSAVDLAFFDCSGLKDHVNNSWNLIYSAKKTVTFVFDVIQGLIRLVVSFLLLQMLGLWMVPIAILLCIPSVFWNKKTEWAEYEFEKKQSKTQRRLEYYKNLFFGNERLEIRLYHLKEYFTLLYTQEWQKWNFAFLKKEKIRSIWGMVSSVMVILNETIVYVVSVVKLVAGTLSVGDITYYVSLVARFKDDFNTVAYCITSFHRSVSELEDVRSFTEMKPLLEKTGQKIPSEKPVVEFKDVSFHYPNSDYNVLNHCSFIIQYGETIGLVGLNGSGKSTIVKLLCRFYDPTDGKILIDGIDYKECDIVQLRQRFGVLFQDYAKYSLSLRENIAIADMSRIDNTEAIYEACRRSKVSDFIVDWEHGVDENLTRRFDKQGKELSGGQWQRIALARAFFRDAPVILLDEPSAALDPVAEHQIFEDFSNISNSKSAVLISHRLSSITLADKILVLEDGHIIEQGTHQELLGKNGRYAHLFNLQASKYL